MRGQTQAPAVKTNAAGTPPRDPDKTLRDMIDTIVRLKSVYERETEALENIDTQRFLSIQEEKFSTAKDYQNGVQTIMAFKGEMKKANPALKRELENLQAGFSELSFKNMDALKRMQRTMERLGGTIRKAAKEEVKKQRALSYNASGKIKDDNKKRISLGVSETA